MKKLFIIITISLFIYGCKPIYLRSPIGIGLPKDTALNMISNVNARVDTLYFDYLYTRNEYRHNMQLIKIKFDSLGIANPENK